MCMNSHTHTHARSLTHSLNYLLRYRLLALFRYMGLHICGEPAGAGEKRHSWGRRTRRRSSAELLQLLLHDLGLREASHIRVPSLLLLACGPPNCLVGY